MIAPIAIVAFHRLDGPGVSAKVSAEAREVRALWCGERITGLIRRMGVFELGEEIRVRPSFVSPPSIKWLVRWDQEISTMLGGDLRNVCQE